MNRLIQITILTLAALAPLAAQTVPQGWKQRIDRSASASDPDAAGNVKFVIQGGGLHATNPQAANYWNPANTASGAYTVKATFTLVKPASHPCYYGLIVGGSNLDGAEQSYLYFQIEQNGTWLIKSRNGNATQQLSQKTPNDAVKKVDANGTSVNTLEVRVGADKVDFVVNGVVVNSAPKTDAFAKTDGIYGLRVTHLLEVQIDGSASPVAREEEATAALFRRHERPSAIRRRPGIS